MIPFVLILDLKFFLSLFLFKKFDFLLNLLTCFSIQAIVFSIIQLLSKRFFFLMLLQSLLLNFLNVWLDNIFKLLYIDSLRKVNIYLWNILSSLYLSLLHLFKFLVSFFLNFLLLFLPLLKLLELLCNFKTEPMSIPIVVLVWLDLLIKHLHFSTHSFLQLFKSVVFIKLTVDRFSKLVTIV